MAPKKAKPRRTYVVKSKLISAIRNLTRICPMRNDIMNMAKKTEEGISSKGKVKRTPRWECNHCKILFPKTLVVVDHIYPIVSTAMHHDLFSYDRYIANAFYGFNEYNGTYADKEALKERAQVLCLDCHGIKTAQEDAERKLFKELYKNEKEKKSKKERLQELLEKSLAAKKAEADKKRTRAIEKYHIENAKRREAYDPVQIMKEFVTQERLEKLAKKEARWKAKREKHLAAVKEHKEELYKRYAKEAKENYDKLNKDKK